MAYSASPRSGAFLVSAHRERGASPSTSAPSALLDAAPFLIVQDFLRLTEPRYHRQPVVHRAEFRKRDP